MPCCRSWRQCRPASTSRSSFSYASVPETAETLAVRAAIDVSLLDHPDQLLELRMLPNAPGLVIFNFRQTYIGEAIDPENLMAGKTLIFPGGMPGSLAHMEACRSRGLDVIGASSLHYDANKALYPAWTYLPFLSDENFDSALDQVISEHGITDIFTPHPIIWDHLRDRLEGGWPAPSMNPSPSATDVKPYRQAIMEGKLAPLPVHFANAQEQLSDVQAAALLYHAGKISGMCDRDKARALIEIFRCLPKGDVVEIGSWWGKSAFIMLRLSQIYEIGKLLCIDPWASENLVQNDSSGLVDRMVSTIDVDEAHRIFSINLLPYAKDDINYLRMPAQQAFEVFVANSLVASPEFGSTTYSGAIAALHIDGNHSYENAKADVVRWSKLVVDGGWIIIDDYVWPWGDGPQRAGDAFITEQSDKIACMFVMGTALFVQLREAL